MKAAGQVAIVAVGVLVAAGFLNLLSQIDFTRNAADFFQRGLRG